MKDKVRKHLCASSLLSAVYKDFKRVPDKLAGKTHFPLSNCLMSALAIFSLKYRSLLQFNDSQRDEKVRHNLKKLFFIKKVPSDTYMRERLDIINPAYFQRAFKSCFRALQRGKVLPLFYFIEDTILVSSDATGFFHSKQVHCKNCCVKQHRDGSTSYYHNMLCAVMVSPEQKTVIPLTAEPISNEHNGSKNDCEHRASERLLVTLRRMHPKLKMVIVEDALYSTGPHITLLKQLNYQFIINVKPARHVWLFDHIKAATCKTLSLTRDEKQYTFKWHNGAPLNDTHHDLKVNFLCCTETDKKGHTKTFTWVTSFNITKNNVFRLMEGARARWKIENETFNTLKTQGYHFEHNFGHGYEQLSTIMALSVLLAFLIDQIQQCCCPIFIKALKKCKKRIRLWEKMRTWFSTFYIDSWEAFFSAIADPPNFRLTIDSS